MLENGTVLEDDCKPFMLLLGSSRHAKLGHLFVDFWNRFFPSSHDGLAVQAVESAGELDADCRRCADGCRHCVAGSLEPIAETLAGLGKRRHFLSLTRLHLLRCGCDAPRVARVYRFAVFDK